MASTVSVADIVSWDWAYLLGSVFALFAALVSLRGSSKSSKAVSDMEAAVRAITAEFDKARASLDKHLETSQKTSQKLIASLTSSVKALANDGSAGADASGESG